MSFLPFFNLIHCNLLVLMATAASAQQGTHCPCKDIAALSLPGVTITLAESVPGGSFISLANKQPVADLPDFCRVAATLKPAAGSNIRIEVWLPENDWNGRFLGTGNGGGAGGIAYGPLYGGLRRGFATANTDMGTSPGANEAVGHPERWIDFGHRATHEMTLTAKSITNAYYKNKIQYAYFAGCSTGGQQALMGAQRYPEDYNGIMAGAPANNRTHLHTGFVWNCKVANEYPDAVLPPGKIAFVTKAVIKACAGKDGGAPTDDFLTNPAACHFDPETLPKCPPGKDEAGCLTDKQLTTLKSMYKGPVNPRTGERIYTPIPVGSENSASGLVYQQNALQSPSALFYPYKWVFGREFDYKTFDFDKDQDKLDAELAPVLNANNTDLRALQKRGGKLLMYSGTADPLVPYQDAVTYYERVVREQGGNARTQTFFRFFLIPGMAHCGGGPGLNDCGQSLSLNVPKDSRHDLLTALMKWVEAGEAPDRIIATAYNGADVRNGIRFRRPVYPYPHFPAYTGGDVNVPESFKGASQKKHRVQSPARRYLR